MLLEGCEARDVIAGNYVALLAKRLLVERGMLRRPSKRRHQRWREGERLPLPRVGGSAGLGEDSAKVILRSILVGHTGVLGGVRDALQNSPNGRVWDVVEHSSNGWVRY